MNKLLISPLFVFLATWGLVISLYQLRWSDLLIFPSEVIINFSLIYLILPFAIGSLFSFGGLLLYGNYKHVNILGSNKVHINFSTHNILSFRLKIIIYFFVISSLLEFFIFKGTPLIWVFTGDSRSYIDYGIPSFHGLLNAANLYLMMVSFIYAVKKEVSWLWFVALLAWLVLMLSRFLIMIAIVELFFLYLMLINKICFRQIAKLLILIIGVSLVFGLLGDLRSVSALFTDVVALNSNYPEWLPTQFLWGYMYMVTPYNNLINMVDLDFGNYTLPHVLSGLFPSVIRGVIYDGVKFIDDRLVSDTFNMSTGYAGIIKDVGPMGIIIFNLLMGFFSTVSWRLVKGINSAFIYAVVIQSVFFMIFFNPLFTLPVIFQFFFIAVCSAGNHSSYKPCNGVQ